MSAEGAIADLVAALTDPTRAVPAGEFPKGSSTEPHAGLYTWWADDDARELFAQVLGARLPALIYAGQAGATAWPSGKASTATLASRIGGNHLRGTIRGSTFRFSIASLLYEPLNLSLKGSQVLTPESNRAVTEWMCQHLRVAVAAIPDRETLGVLEGRVLDAIDPPLNLKGRPSTPVRRQLSALRGRLRVR